MNLHINVRACPNILHIYLIIKIHIKTAINFIRFPDGLDGKNWAFKIDWFWYWKISINLAIKVTFQKFKCAYFTINDCLVKNILILFLVFNEDQDSRLTLLLYNPIDPGPICSKIKTSWTTQKKQHFDIIKIYTHSMHSRKGSGAVSITGTFVYTCQYFIALCNV